MKRDKIKRRPLADTTLANLEPESTEYRELDSPGLYFRVRPNGSKSWNLRYKRPNGKWAWLGLGKWPDMSGQAARDQAAELLARARAGEDLAADSDQSPRVQAFAQDWYTRRVQDGLAPKTLHMIRRALDMDILPAIGNKHMADVTRADCTALVDKIEGRGAYQIAKKVRGILNQIFRLAVAQGHMETNPASELSVVARTPPPVKHHPYLLEPELPAFLRALDRSNSTFQTRAAVWMVILTASRPGMVRHAEWCEIDLASGTWTIPGEKMKSRRDLVVALPKQLTYVLQNIQELNGNAAYVFPGATHKARVISPNTINIALDQIGYKGRLVGHGARHTASTLLREHGWRKEYVEMQLAHTESGVAGVYNKAQYLDQRRVMMQWYADYLDVLKAGMTEKVRAEFDSRVIR